MNENVALGLGSYGQYIVLDCSKKLAIAKFCTYETAGDKELTKIDFD